MNAPDRGGNIVHIIHHSNQFTACMLAVAPLSQYLFSTVRHGLVKLPANFGPTPPRILDSASNCLQAVDCLQDCLQNHRTHMLANPAILTAESSGISGFLVRLAAEKRTARPLSTYRLQFHAGFLFEHARRMVGYLHALGISHVYSSPILKARAGSQHGYDITDHNQLNPEVGSYEQLQDLVRELKNYGMGQVLDFVPNHMGIGPGTNPWWWDVLSSGRASEFAEFFSRSEERR